MSRPSQPKDSQYAMSYQEIAEELGIPERTVQSIARRALRKLRLALILEGIDPSAVLC